MHWLILILVLAMVIGPVMYFVPTARDKRLMTLRLQARRLGLNVEITHLPRLNPSADERVTSAGKVKDPTFACTAYQLPVTREEINLSCRLQRIPENATMLTNESVPGWHVTDAQGAEPVRLQGQTEALVAFLQTVPGSWFAVSVDRRFLSVYWDEKAAAESDSVEQVAAFLAKLQMLSVGLARG